MVTVFLFSDGRAKPIDLLAKYISAEGEVTIRSIYIYYTSIYLSFYYPDEYRSIYTNSPNF